LDESICYRESCKQSIEMRKTLIECIKEFKEFFTGKIPTEEVYREYLESVGLEEKYRNFAYSRDDRQPPKCTRRVWFQLNTAQSHHEWADEFDRHWAGINNE